jgi:hypothetical protein
MTVLTDAGLFYLADHAFGNEPAVIDAIAVGTGTAPESPDDTTLANETYRTDPSNSNITLQESDSDPSTYEAIITLKGGTEVPGDSAITELGVFAGGSQDDQTGNITGPNILVFRDVASPITIESGHTVELILPIDFDAL